jgi:hypothetical protein
MIWTACNSYITTRNTTKHHIDRDTRVVATGQALMPMALL